MYYLVFVSDDAECKTIYGPAQTEGWAVDKLIDYIEVGLVTGKKRILTDAEKQYISEFKTLVVDKNGSAWFIVKGKNLL